MTHGYLQLLQLQHTTRAPRPEDASLSRRHGIGAGPAAGRRVDTAAQTLPGEVKAKAKTVPNVSDAWVEVVWEPTWDMSKISDAAKLQLGLL